MKSVALGLTVVLGAAAAAGAQPSDATARGTRGALAGEAPGQTAEVGPPAAPPGSTAYPHAKVRSRTYGKRGKSGWLFAPDEPAPATAPVVVFLPGWGAFDPGHYGAWIRHLTRKGYLVIYPRYQPSLLTSGKKMQRLGFERITEGFASLDTGRVKPDRTQVALVGHSLGGAMATAYTMHAEREQLPKPTAVFLVQPAAQDKVNGRFDVPVDGTKLPSDVLLLGIVGEHDKLAQDGWARKLFSGATGAVPAANRSLVLHRSDDHGSPALGSGHFAPIGFDLGVAETPARKIAAARRIMRLKKGETGVDAVDRWAYWRLLDGLLDAAFKGGSRAAALLRTPASRAMGAWGDGTPVKPLEPIVIGDDPPIAPEPVRRGR